MSSRLAAPSKALFLTTHGGSTPSASPNKSVSRIAAPPPLPAWPGVIGDRGRCPQTPGIYLTHDDVPVYHERAVQPGTAMTAHGDQVRCHIGAGLPSRRKSTAAIQPTQDANKF